MCRSSCNSIAGPDNVYKALKGEIPWTPSRSSRRSIQLNNWWQKGYFGAELLLAHGRAGLRPARHRAGRHGADRHLELPECAALLPARTMRSRASSASRSAEASARRSTALGIGSTFSIAATSQNPDGAAAVIDYVFTDKFYGDMNSVWQGEWNIAAARPLQGADLARRAAALHRGDEDSLAASVNNGPVRLHHLDLPAAGHRHLSRQRHGRGVAEQDHAQPTTSRSSTTTFKQEQGRRQGSGGAGAGLSASCDLPRRRRCR